MEYYLERLERELKRIMDFWMQNLISKEDALLYPECSINGTPNKTGLLGSLYLGRVMYGASAACRFFNTNRYKPLADLAFKTLYEKFRNPAGGFYWAKRHNGEVVHDSDNINMAQAFVLYGLSEYASLTKNPIVEGEIKKLQIFLQKTIYDPSHKGYFDGHSIDWKQEKNYTKSLGTHLHLMEALVKSYLHTSDKQLVPKITEIIEIVGDKFIDPDTPEFYHRLTPDWNKLPNSNWAGHNAEAGWLLVWASTAIKNDSLRNHSCQLAHKLTLKVIEQAFDKNYGGIFNEIKDGAPAEQTKYWWPQAESALACMNAYNCSKDKMYLSYGLRLIEYIENTFSDETNGEWYTTVTREGMPVGSEPKVNLWKSMYHNVRYCIEMHGMIKGLIQ